MILITGTSAQARLGRERGAEETKPLCLGAGPQMGRMSGRVLEQGEVEGGVGPGGEGGAVPLVMKPGESALKLSEIAAEPMATARIQFRRKRALRG